MAANVQRSVGIPEQAFTSPEDAWFWAMTSLQARREGARGGGAGVPRPCEPDDILRCLDGLYRNQRIGLPHARVLRTWGERRARPDPSRDRGSEYALWQEAMDRMEPILRQKGIVS